MLCMGIQITSSCGPTSPSAAKRPAVYFKLWSLDAVVLPTNLPRTCSEADWEAVNKIRYCESNVVHERQVSWSVADSATSSLCNSSTSFLSFPQSCLLQTGQFTMRILCSSTPLLHHTPLPDSSHCLPAHLPLALTFQCPNCECFHWPAQTRNPG